MLAFNFITFKILLKNEFSWSRSSNLVDQYSKLSVCSGQKKICIHNFTFWPFSRSKGNKGRVWSLFWMSFFCRKQWNGNLFPANLRFSIHWSTYICKFWCFYPEVHANFLICPTIVDIFRCLKMVPSTSRPLCSQKITHSDPSPSFPIVRSQLVIVHSCPRVHGTNYYK